MANPMQALNEHFFYNTRMARTLQQLLTPFERKMMEIWFDKLLDLDKTQEEMAIRSDYMWFILLMLQNKKIREPFTKLPPSRIVPLKQYVPLHIYEDVLLSNEPNMIYPDKKKGDPIIRPRGTATTSMHDL